MINEIKKSIREEMIKHRDSLSIDIKEKWDENIFNNFINSKFYKYSNTIFSFVSFKSEVDTHKIIKYALNDGKTIYVPKVKSKQKEMEIFKIEGFNDLKKGYFGILEPVEGCKTACRDNIDLILMPGLAFDKYGGRIGYGAGFYDRFLSSIKKDINKIALAYKFQVIDKVPEDKNDIRIDGIITEEDIILTNKN
ncbi:5-formyltetrahydrofolate cyclo-ligase [Clostridium sp. USBA 49]|uniref:5-formyltetrahydrofolate cyclo-ligase n=1 Tax=Clostridium sp. USBA 49 TaxID=1881060 RepID=UPI00099AD745|nr:5-formyltetrahydrofolate cyclo-ligase [Clostridium sp. USBA 49]SKA73609.1 5-formyltetrahydrofolate cyclo-ligase [Clostridium sp. USBA 49]